jgi:malonate transporter and related proteins
MSYALLLLPDCLLILTGLLLCHYTALGRPVWEAAERLVYFVFFPALLFTAIARNPLQLGQATHLALAGLATVSCGIAMAYVLSHWPQINQWRYASGAQTAFRFNSYVGLALADRLGGAPSVAWMAVLLAVCVPVCNLAAVLPLAKQGGHSVGREVVRNPMIVSTLSGLAFNLLGLQLPDVLSMTLQRVAAAALPVGLMAVGAGLHMGSLRASPRMAAAFMGVRHAVLPLIALGLVKLLGLPLAQQSVVVLFAALPTASGAYVLAARLGGDAPFVSGLVTVSTVLGMLSIPFWLGWV